MGRWDGIDGARLSAPRSLPRLSDLLGPAGRALNRRIQHDASRRPDNAADHRPDPLGTWWWLRSGAGASDLLATETAAWRVSAFRGLGMVVGFAAMAALVRNGRDDIARYVDPAM